MTTQEKDIKYLKVSYLILNLFLNYKENMKAEGLKFEKIFDIVSQLEDQIN